MAEATGRVVQILGGVVDVDFGDNKLPEIYDAVEVLRGDEKPLILEVQNHLGNGWVRTVAMDSTDGLVRGMAVVNTESPIQVPVGEASLGRVFNGRLAKGQRTWFKTFRAVQWIDLETEGPDKNLLGRIEKALDEQAGQSR